MPEFHYRAIDEHKKMVAGKRRAISAEELAHRLLEERLIPLDIQGGGDSGESKGLSLSFARLNLFKKKVSPNDLQMFCRQMYTLLKSGFPIFIAVTRLSETTRDKQLKTSLHEILATLNKGQSLSYALSLFPNIFTAFYVNLVKVGENTGRLDEIFLYLAEYIALEDETHKKIKVAIRYPSFVMIAMIVAMIIMNVFVIPSFAQMFKDFKGVLPLPTQLVMATSAFIVNYWYILLFVFLSLFFGFRYKVGTPEGAVKWAAFKLRLPLIGWIIHRMTLARFSILYAMVLRSGLTAVEGIDLVGRSSNDVYFAQQLKMATELIGRGDSIAASVEKTKLFPPLMLQMITLGEESGNIELLLDNVAEFYQREAGYDLDKLSDAIEPILLIFMACMVLILALAVFLPMWSIAGQIQA